MSVAKHLALAMDKVLTSAPSCVESPATLSASALNFSRRAGEVARSVLAPCAFSSSRLSSPMRLTARNLISQIQGLHFDILSLPRVVLERFRLVVDVDQNSSVTKEFGAERLSLARTVLHHAPELSEQVLAGT